MYRGLVRVSFPYSNETEKDIEIATALTYISYFVMHASKYLNVCLRYPMWITSGNKALILKDQYRIYWLNPSKTTASQFEQAFEMLTENICLLSEIINIK